MSKQLPAAAHAPADLAATARAAADFGAAADLVDEAAAAALGVNRTDLRILWLVSQSGPLSAAALAGAAKLSPAATTTAIQRLVAARHLTRTVDQDDRRRAVVALTPHAEALIDRVYAPIERAGHRILASYSADELALIAGFLRRGIDMQVAEADRVRALTRS
ncbi:MarR family transcriptional regulator [Actinoplanes sp. ATCC 53533]|uniref:MarR family transcriptional regulator n=1 Tax=Actinoplanes sp. ATCC 53533 TaxID=1288362 RepID=UPI0013157400|nr:MarR family transcriptional regulator [Actinoplanes sp. ATCC 53533]